VAIIQHLKEQTMCNGEVMQQVQDGADAAAAPAESGATEAAVAEAQEVLSSALRRSRGRTVDLTHAFDVNFPVLQPFVQPPQINHFATIPTHGFNANLLVLDEHTGTHMDGPAHLADDAGVFTNDIPPERLVVPLAVIDVTRRAAENPDVTLSVDDIRQYERRHGRIPRGAFVAANFGWAARVPTPGAYINRDVNGTPHFPGLSAEAMRFLVEERSIAGAGLDTPSIDPGVSVMNPAAHRALLGGTRYGVENINNLPRIPQAGSVVVIGLIRHSPGYGGPVRMLSLI
jgi:kynurenine formamidase